MELSIGEIEILNNLFIAANSNNTTIRDKALEDYKTFIKSPKAVVALLIFQGLPNIENGQRMLSAISFKNFVKDSWVSGDEVENPIPSSDKEIVKSLLLNFVLQSNNNTQPQLLEAMSIIGQSEFPQQWPTILPDLISKMDTSDIQLITVVLKMLHSLLKKYRNTDKNNQTLKELKYILSILPTPYLNLLVKTGTAVDASLGDDKQLCSLLNCVHFLLEIFFSMSSVDLPEFFEDNLAAFTNEFHRYLKLNVSYPSVIESFNDQDPSLLKKIQASICEIINLYTQIYDEEFSTFLQPFVQVVWGLLTQTSKDISNDSFVYSAIKFLGTVATSISHKIFESPETLKQICSMIVTPNIELRECDIEMYEDNCPEYIRRDIEGSDSDTRRRAAIELVKGLRKYYEEQITQLVSIDINNLLQNYNKDKENNWISKDSAIFLVTALAVKNSMDDSTHGGSSLVNVVDFYKTQIESELMDPNTKPILKADCLKFITIFRNQIPAEEYPRILQGVVPCLQNPDYIIHTYASTCIDRLLSVKDNGVPRLSTDFISTHLTSLLLPLVNVFSFKESHQNEKTMRTIVRIVLMTQGKIDQQITFELLKKFVSIIMEEAKNPCNHAFTHYCFEVIGTLLKAFSAESQVFDIIKPLVEVVLQTNNADFSPYCYQLLAILVESSTPENLATFRPLFSILLNATVWTRDADYPALVRLLQAFIKKDSASIVANNQISAILGIFEKLVNRMAHDHEAFFILESLVESLDIQHLEKYLPAIFSSILVRISSKKTQKVVRCFTIFFSLFMVKYGVLKTAEIVRKVKPTLWEDILIKLWLPTVEDINGVIEKKIISVSLTKMICCVEILTTPDLWIKLIQCQSNVILGKKSEETLKNTSNDEPLYIDQAETNEGYVPTFTQLQFSKKVDTDPFPTISNPKDFFITSFQTFRSQNDNNLITELLKQSNIQI